MWCAVWLLLCTTASSAVYHQHIQHTHINQQWTLVNYTLSIHNNQSIFLPKQITASRSLLHSLQLHITNGQFKPSPPPGTYAQLSPLLPSSTNIQTLLHYLLPSTVFSNFYPSKHHLHAYAPRDVFCIQHLSAWKRLHPNPPNINSTALFSSDYQSISIAFNPETFSLSLTSLVLSSETSFLFPDHVLDPHPLPPPPPASLSSHRFLSQFHPMHVALAIDLFNNDTVPVALQILDFLPWQLVPHFNTVSVYVNDSCSQDSSLSEAIWKDSSVEMREYVLSRCMDPIIVTFNLTVPAFTRIVVSYSLQKRFIRAEEFGLDISRGIDIVSGLIRCLDTETMLHTNPLIVLMPVPDMSMTLNVIAFNSTLFAFLFGSMFNVLHRSGEEMLQRRQNSAKSGIWAKLIRR